MVQIVRDRGLGEKLGTGLGEGLRYLAENRLGRIQNREDLLAAQAQQQALRQQQQQQRQSGLQALFGNQAQALSSLDTELLKSLISGHIKAQGNLNKELLQAPANAAYLEQLYNMANENGIQLPGQPQQIGQQSAVANLSNLSRSPVQLNPTQAANLLNLGLKQKQVGLKEQENLAKHYRKFIEGAQQESKSAQLVRQLAEQAKELFDTGKVSSGILGNFTPSVLQNQETQMFAGLINELITKKAQLGKGTPSKARLMLEQSSKPSLWQKPGAIRYRLRRCY
jgi:hypothetical protein